MIFRCIERAISSILGKDATYSLFYAVATNLRLSEKELERSPDKLIEGLQLILGHNGFTTLERGIVNEICQQFRVSGAERMTLREVIDEARRSYLS